MLRKLLLLLLCLGTFISYGNNDCSNAVPLTPGTSCSTTTGTFSAATITGAAPTCGTEALQDVWYKFTATDVTHGIYLNAVTGLNHGFEIRQGGCNGTVVACTNDFFAGNAESYYDNNFVVGQEYYIRVFNATAQFTTASFTICVRKFPTPVNDLCANAMELTPDTVCTYVGATFIGSTNDGPALACPSSASILQDVWFKFTATEQTYSIYINPHAGLNTGVQIFEGSCSGAMVGCINNSGINTSEYYQNNNFVIGQTYYLRFFHVMGGYSTQNISFCVTKYPKPVNDTCQTAMLILQNTTCSQVAATLSGAIADGSAASCAPQAGQDLWFKFIAQGSSANVYVGPVSGIDLGFEVFQGGCNGNVIACINNVTTNFSETGTIANLTPGTEYYVRVFNVNPSISNGIFTICVYGAIQPCNASVSIAASATEICAGGQVTFSATPVNGGASPQYQWKVDGSNVGTNSPTFTTSTLNHGNVVTCVMTSSLQCPAVPTVTSNAITMTVTNPVTPAFTQVDAICTGGSFTLPSTSTNGITGNWIPAVNNTLTTTYTFTPTAGQCAVTTTMTVTVNNNATPTFTQIAAVCQGGSFTLPSTSDNGIVGAWSPAINNSATTTYTFTPNAGQCAATATMIVVVNAVNTSVTTTGATITASATGAAYQWVNCADNQFINGATNASFTAPVNGSYAVIVTQNGCSATSECVLITNLGTDSFIHKGWKVYPNPVIAQLFIDTEDATDIVITDMTGKAISSQALQSGINIIGTDSLSPGMYLIKSASGAHAKFIKQ